MNDKQNHQNLNSVKKYRSLQYEQSRFELLESHQYVEQCELVLDTLKTESNAIRDQYCQALSNGNYLQINLMSDYAKLLTSNEEKLDQARKKYRQAKGFYDEKMDAAHKCGQEYSVMDKLLLKKQSARNLDSLKEQERHADEMILMRSDRFLVGAGEHDE